MISRASTSNHTQTRSLNVEFPDYDPARLKRLAYKLEEGFINAGELM